MAEVLATLDMLWAVEMVGLFGMPEIADVLGVFGNSRRDQLRDPYGFHFGRCFV